MRSQTLQDEPQLEIFLCYFDKSQRKVMDLELSTQSFPWGQLITPVKMD